MAGRGVDIMLGGNAEHLTRVELRKLGVEPDDESWDETWEDIFPRVEEQVDGGPRAGEGARRPVHPRHRAPRVAAHRQPAARPLRAPGRPGRVALLPVRRGRPGAPVRGRPHLPDPGPARPRGRRGPRAADRGQDAVAHDRERAEEGRAAELPDPQARARVRRRDEPAARGGLQVPARDPRGPRHVRARQGGAARRVRADRAGVHARRLHRGLGRRRPVRAGAADLRPELRRRRTSTPRRSTATSSPTGCTTTRSRPTAAARASWARS